MALRVRPRRPAGATLRARPIAVSLLAIVLFGLALQWVGLVAAIAVLMLIGANPRATCASWTISHLRR
jgi:hypothetical protein